MTEQQIAEMVKSAKPMISIMTQFPTDKRTLARVAMESFGAGLRAARSGDFDESSHIRNGAAG